MQQPAVLSIHLNHVLQFTAVKTHTHTRLEVHLKPPGDPGDHASSLLPGNDMTLHIFWRCHALCSNVR